MGRLVVRLVVRSSRELVLLADTDLVRFGCADRAAQEKLGLFRERRGSSAAGGAHCSGLAAAGACDIDRLAGFRRAPRGSRTGARGKVLGA